MMDDLEHGSIEAKRSTKQETIVRFMSPTAASIHRNSKMSINDKRLDKGDGSPLRSQKKPVAKISN